MTSILAQRGSPSLSSHSYALELLLLRWAVDAFTVMIFPVVLSILAAFNAVRLR